MYLDDLLYNSDQFWFGNLVFISDESSQYNALFSLLSSCIFDELMKKIRAFLRSKLRLLSNNTSNFLGLTSSCQFSRVWEVTLVGEVHLTCVLCT